MVIIMTNRKCPIVQQSRVGRWKTLYSNKSEDNETDEYDKNNGKIVSLSLSEKRKKTWTSRTEQRSMSCILM